MVVRSNSHRVNRPGWKRSIVTPVLDLKPISDCLIYEIVLGDRMCLPYLDDSVTCQYNRHRRRNKPLLHCGHVPERVGRAAIKRACAIGRHLNEGDAKKLFTAGQVTREFLLSRDGFPTVRTVVMVEQDQPRAGLELVRDVNVFQDGQLPADPCLGFENLVAGRDYCRPVEGEDRSSQAQRGQAQGHRGGEPP